MVLIYVATLLASIFVPSGLITLLISVRRYKGVIANSALKSLAVACLMLVYVVAVFGLAFWDWKILKAITLGVV